MKRKLVSSVLAVAMLLSASKTFADDPPPPPDDGEPAPALVQACYVVVIGGIVAVGLWKLCKSIPDPGEIPHQYPTPPTNPPPVINPTNAPPTNKPPWYKRMLGLDVATNALHSQNISPFGRMDSAGHVYTTLVNYELQSSTNALDWRTELTATGWCSSGAAFFAYYSNGVPLHTTYSDSYGQTNYVSWNLGTGDEPAKMFRLLSVH